MSKPFDASTKYLIQTHPADWIAFVGLPTAPVRVIDADLSTVTSAPDKLLRLDGPHPEIVHLDLQAGYERDLGERMLEYNVLAGRRHRLPVRSIAVLLRPSANSPAIDGVVEHRYANGFRYHEFLYEVIRLWEMPVEAILSGGPGIVPLAPLTDDAAGRLPEVIARMEARFGEVVGAGEAAELWVATYVLLGLRYAAGFATQLLRGVRAMKESVTYQAILAEGRVEGEARGEAIGEARGEAKGKTVEARALLIALGSKRLGVPSAGVRQQIEAESDLARLHRLALSVLDVENWNELLAEAGHA